MKIFGLFDSKRKYEELKMLLTNMESQLNSKHYLNSEDLIIESFGIGHLYLEGMNEDEQPIWNEDRTKIIVMVGKIFDFEEKRANLIEKGHIFKYANSEAEFVLHGFEEWGSQLLENLNGFFVFVIFDLRKQEVTLFNDRCGMKPLYYYHNNGLFIFASEVKAIIEDHKIEKEVNWAAWRDFFSYGFMMGNKTPFKNIFSLSPGTILTFNSSRKILLKKYWEYSQVKIDYESEEQYFVSKGAELLKHAIQRQTSSLSECIVLLSGGYDSRFIASAIRHFTIINFETFTTKPSHFLDSKRSIGARLIHWLDPILAKEVAKTLKVKNEFIPRPFDLYGKYLVEKVFLLDGMCLEHLWMMPVVEKLAGTKVNFDGLSGGITLRGGLITREGLASIGNNEKLANALDKQLRHHLGYPTKLIIDFFKSPIHEKLIPEIGMLTSHFESTGNNENAITIFTMENRIKNSMALSPNNLLGNKAFCIFPFLDKDVLEFSFTIPPSMKINNKIYRKILTKMFPEIMKIPATTFFSLTSFIRWRKEYLILIPLLTINFIFKYKSSRKRDAQNLLHILDSLVIPEYLNIERTKEMAQAYLSKGKDPMPFLAPIVEFCIWYNLFFKRTLRTSE